jgi:2-hydroxychromene-2-carboxylate isomerase
MVVLFGICVGVEFLWRKIQEHRRKHGVTIINNKTFSSSLSQDAGMIKNLKMELQDSNQMVDALLVRIAERDRRIEFLSSVIKGFDQAMVDVIREKQQISEEWEQTRQENMMLTDIIRGLNSGDLQRV